MIGRLFYIALLTGLGQLFIVAVLKLASVRATPLTIATLGQIDSYFQNCMTIIAMGLNSIAIRNIATTNHWQTEYISVQSARIMVGYSLVPLGLLSFLYPSFIVFFAAPIIAYSGEYALYGLGRPVLGSIIAMVRAFVPYGIVLFFLFINPDAVPITYLIGLMIVFFITNLIIAKKIGVPVFIKPKLSKLILYYQSLSLGILNFAFFFIGLGLLSLVSFLYPNLPFNLAIAFVGLKFYAIYKSIIRIIHQAFLKDMVDQQVCFLIDKLSMMLSFSLLGALIFFPNSFIQIFFGKIYLPYHTFFLALAITSLIFSFAFSLATNLVLRKMDKKLRTISLLAILGTAISALIISILSKKAWPIALSLLVGELLFSFGIISINRTWVFVKQRLLFLLKISPLFLILIALRVFMSDTVLNFFVALSIFTFVLFISNLKQFNTLKLTR